MDKSTHSQGDDVNLDNLPRQEANVHQEYLQTIDDSVVTTDKFGNETVQRSSAMLETIPRMYHLALSELAEHYGKKRDETYIKAAEHITHSLERAFEELDYAFPATEKDIKLQRENYYQKSGLMEEMSEEEPEPEPEKGNSVWSLLGGKRG